MQSLAALAAWSGRATRRVRHWLARCQAGGVAALHDAPAVCAACPLRAQCTTSATGRSVAIHPDERLLAEFRARQATPAGRAALRQRVSVEHDLAHIGRWQGDHARYRGARTNRCELRRVAVVNNLHVLKRTAEAA